MEPTGQNFRCQDPCLHVIFTGVMFVAHVEADYKDMKSIYIVVCFLFVNLLPLF